MLSPTRAALLALSALTAPLSAQDLLFTSRFTDESGNVVVRRNVPQSLVGVTLLLQAADLGSCNVSPVVSFTFQ